MKISKLIFLFVIVLFFSCKEPVYTPKKIAYPQIYMPHLDSFVTFAENCPYTFEYPNYTTIENDSFFFDEKVMSDCWINLVYPSLNAKVHFSYKEIGKDITLEKVMEDSHELAYTHSKKADYIDELEIKTPHNVEGKMIEIGGNTANNLQFYLTDYENHYLRGALYFTSHPNEDSVKPALQFIKNDMLHVFETFEWEK
ncbi:MAG: hypothetical protein R2836_01650 [Chitinophagales bacterium]|nr:hypothetical protein [Chitinophagales bacterium]